MMKHFLKGAAVTAAMMIVLMGVSIFCNMQGMELNTLIFAPAAGACSILIYNAWIQKENKEENREN